MGKWAALVTLGCFCILASYAYGKTARGAWRHPAAPVVLIRDACADDWLCQLQHSPIYRAPRAKHVSK